jgi:hypothetical protein
MTSKQCVVGRRGKCDQGRTQSGLFCWFGTFFILTWRIERLVLFLLLFFNCIFIYLFLAVLEFEHRE